MINYPQPPLPPTHFTPKARSPSGINLRKSLYLSFLTRTEWGVVTCRFCKRNRWKDQKWLPTCTEELGVLDKLMRCFTRLLLSTGSDSSEYNNHFDTTQSLANKADVIPYSWLLIKTAVWIPHVLLHSFPYSWSN